MAIDRCKMCEQPFDRDHHTECPRCGPAIVTSYDPKPIPTRAFDWCAVFDGYDGGDPIGFGLCGLATFGALVLGWGML
jgi:hypothetical protein